MTDQPAHLIQLEDAIYKFLPAFIDTHRRGDSQLFAVRPHAFIDASDPEFGICQ